MGRGFWRRGKWRIITREFVYGLPPGVLEVAAFVLASIILFIFISLRKRSRRRKWEARPRTYGQRHRKAGIVYVASNVRAFGEGIYKIGMTQRADPHKRIAELYNTAVPFWFEARAIIHAKNAEWLENHLHTQLAQYRVNPYREFFRVDLATIRAAVRKYAPKAYFVMHVDEKDYEQAKKLQLKYWGQWKLY